jgi:hypothetical protein
MAALVNGIFHRIPAVAWLPFARTSLVPNAAGDQLAVWRL